MAWTVLFFSGLTPPRLLPILRLSLNWSTCVSNWVKKLGMGALLFFLAKGLLWLIIPAIIVLWRTLA